MSKVRSLSGDPKTDEAMWKGDLEYLHRTRPCRCCCHEHTQKDCKARAWNGCKGQGTP